MATAIHSSVMTEHLGNLRAWPSLESVTDSMRVARSAVGAARHATENLAAAVVSKVERYPLRAVGIAMGVGAVAGSLVGFGFAWFARIRA